MFGITLISLLCLSAIEYGADRVSYKDDDESAELDIGETDSLGDDSDPSRGVETIYQNSDEEVCRYQKL